MYIYQKTKRYMKTKFLLYFFLIFNYSYGFSGIKSTVDERVELMTIIAHLAGDEAFNYKFIPEYISDIREYFSDYKNHEVIRTASNIHNQGFAFEKVLALAVNIKITDSIALRTENEDYFRNFKFFDSLPQFICQLNDFYNKTDFKEFFKKNNKLFHNLTEEFDTTIIDKINFDWFEEFFGTAGNYEIILSPVIGRNNYGIPMLDQNNKRISYAIIGLVSNYENGRLDLDAAIGQDLIVHEICHSFCNPVIDSCLNDLFYVSRKIWANQYDRIGKLGNYGMDGAMYETLVRTMELRYNKYKDVSHIISRNIRDGFILTESFNKIFDNYENDREKYQTLYDFIPVMINYFDSIENVITYDTDRSPRVISTSISGKTVPFTTTEIIYTFNKEMYTDQLGLADGKLGKESFPHLNGIEWLDNRNLKISVILEPNWYYSLGLYMNAIYNANRLPLIENHEIIFFTE